MSLKRNVFANYVSQTYVILIGIIMVPIFVRYMGTEAYGLVGFFAVIQAWFQLLDAGLTPTMARETARFQGGAIDALSLRRLVRVLEGVFLGVAVVGGLVLVSGSGLVASRWLKTQTLSLLQVRQALALMAVIVVLRWICGLYRGIISGFEHLVWLGGFNMIVTTLRFVFVIPIFKYIGVRPTDFFGFQLLIAGLELGWLMVKTYSLLPKVESLYETPWNWGPLLKALRFSLGIAFTGAVWVLVTQTDKLVLSRLLKLSDYGVFILAVLVASGVTTLGAPISAALLPRLTRLQAEGDYAGLLKLYRDATQAVGLITFPATFVIAFFAEHVLLVWTGNPLLAHQAAPVLVLYALGNGLLAVGAFPYYLQYAKGDVKLHVIGNALFVVILIPCLILATLHFGVIGAGWAWLGANMLYFVCWIPLVHQRLAKGLHLKWLTNDIIPIIMATSLGAWVAREWIPWLSWRWGRLAELFGIGLGVMLMGVVVSPWARWMLRRQIAIRLKVGINVR